MKIELNQEVFLVGIGNNARYNTPTHTATVSKIGRKWFYVDCPAAFYVARDHRFSLEDGKCDGKGYMPEWQAYESEKEWREDRDKPNVTNEITKSLKGLSYDRLSEILEFINKENEN